MADIATSLNDPLLAGLVQAVPTKVTQTILCVGRSKLYELLGKGELDAVKDGTKTLITTESIKRYQANRLVATFKNPPPPRMESLDRLNEKRRAEAAARADRRRARRRA